MPSETFDDVADHLPRFVVEVYTNAGPISALENLSTSGRLAKAAV
jgi:hypothetical protein